jgi:RraA family protein
VALEPLPTADVSDAAATRIAMGARIRPLWPGARLAGPAFTVRTPPGQFAAVREAVDRAASGDVIVVDAGGEVECALWGDRMSRLAQSRGVAGFVVDGAVRDVAEIERLGFPVFGITSVPTSPGRETAGEVGVPIVCGGVEVRPGDVVYGDADGVVVVPQALHRAVVARIGEE